MNVKINIDSTLNTKMIYVYHMFRKRHLKFLDCLLMSASKLGIEALYIWLSRACMWGRLDNFLLRAFLYVDRGFSKRVNGIKLGRREASNMEAITRK